MNDGYEPPAEPDWDLAEGPDWWAAAAAGLLAFGAAGALAVIWASR